MTVILVLFTFVSFLLIDHFHSRKAVVVQPALATAAAKTPKAVRPTPELVNGFRVPENLRYHPGHTWALSESPSLVRVGMDDFASKLIGKIERVALPPAAEARTPLKRRDRGQLSAASAATRPSPGRAST